MRTRRAFSIVELLTALVLLAVGLAAFVRAAGAVARLESDARLRHTVAATLRARLDSLAGAACDAPHAGQSQNRGVLERWSVRPEGRHLVLAETIIVRARPSLARAYVVSVACPP